MEMTYHAKVERIDRRMMIEQRIGIGNVIRESYHNHAYNCITDTGIVIIKDEKKEKIITMYVATRRNLMAIYGGLKKVPPYLIRKVDHNQSLFTNNGKTIL